jgi:putative Holliday junction resolvase
LPPPSRASSERSRRIRRPVKVLALDYGRARTGVAVSDPTGQVARPLCVVERAATQAGLAAISKLVQDESIERVVVGMPLTLKGERGEQARETERFIRDLEAAIDVPVDSFDERFTTDLVERAPGNAAPDAQAAAHLLTSFLTRGTRA